MSDFVLIPSMRRGSLPNAWASDPVTTTSVPLRLIICPKRAGCYPLSTKKSTQKFPAFFLQNTFCYFYPVIQPLIG
jgi:hypothetical protein